MLLWGLFKVVNVVFSIIIERVVSMVKKIIYFLVVTCAFVMSGCSGKTYTNNSESSKAIELGATVNTQAYDDKQTVDKSEKVHQQTSMEEKTDEQVAETGTIEEKTTTILVTETTADITTTSSAEISTESATTTVEQPTETTTQAATTVIATRETEKDTDNEGNNVDGSPIFEITFNKPEAEYVGYDAERVARLAVEKCKEAGMISLPENLDRLLAEGKITQEEYDEYYPYDGCGYYSVFVETNLNLASTISGERLYTEEDIADYIAGMMVLEVEPYFYIECEGIYQGNSVEFYEFRCYR